MHGSSRVDDRARDVVVPCAQDVLLVHLRRGSLLARDEARPYPHARRAITSQKYADEHQGTRTSEQGGIREGGGETTPVGDATGGDDNHGLAGERALRVLAKVNHCGDEDGEWGFAGVAATFSALRADDVNTCDLG